MNCWPLSLEAKWNDALRVHPEIAGREDEVRCFFYFTEREHEFLWRTKHPEQFHWIACRFCQKEWMWSCSGFRSHLASCKVYAAYIDLLNYRKLLAKRKYINSLHFEELTVEQALHRRSIMEFSGGPESSESSIIHELIEHWCFEDLDGPQELS